MFQKKNQILLFFLFGFFFQSKLFAVNEYQLLDKIIVTVEKDVITESEMQKELHKKFPNMSPNELSKSEIKSQKKEILESLIEKKIILQYASQNNINTSEQEIQIVLNNIFESNNISFEKFEEELIKNGTNLVEFKEDISFQLIIKKIKDREIMPYVNISDYEVMAWLKNFKDNEDIEYKISHILIKNENPNKDLILEKIKKEDFSLIATQYSDGPYAESNGDMGWNRIDDLPEIFVEFIKNAAEGDISQPIKSSNGLHIIKLESIKKSSVDKTILVRQYKFQQILLKTNSITSDDDQEKKLTIIKNNINDGLTFSKAIQQYSDDQFNLDEKKLEWISVNNLVPEFRNQLDKYPAENLIGPFKTQMGWHLIKVYNFREADFTNETKKQQAKIEIAAKKTDIRFKDWLDALLKNSKIKYIKND